MKPLNRLIVAALALVLPMSSQAQTPATLTDFGANAPTPGASDIFQLSSAGNAKFPDGLNYYTDNQTGHNSGEPGQSFTTGNAGGYTLTSIYLKSAGLDSGGGSPGTAINYVLHVYSMSGTTATPIASYITSSTVVYTEGDWLQWTGLSVPLSANTTYAYSFGKADTSAGWDAIGVASGNPYAGGEIGLFPPAGGAVTFGSSHGFDATFDLGLTVQNIPTATPPTITPTNNPVYAGTLVTLTEAASGQAPLFYRWRTDGGGGGARTNIPSATASNLTVSTTSLHAGTYSYDVVVSNASGVATSAVAAVSVVAASAPVLVSDITPSSAIGYVGGQQTFSAAFKGTLPIAYQWQANRGSGITNIPNATNTSLTLSNLQPSNAASYRLLASNSIGGPVASSAAALTVQAAPSFPGAVLAANPVGYWRLDETGSTSGGTLTAVDATGNFNGTYGSASIDGVAGPTPSIGFPGLEVNNTAAQFAYGVGNSFITLPALNLNANTVTITAWVNPIGTPAAYSGIVFCRPGGDASGLGFTDNGQIGYTWNQNNQNTWSWMSGLVPPSGQWSFVAVVISPTNAIAYLCNTNGQSSATNAITHTAEAFNVSTLIGDDSADGGNGTRTFNGAVDEVAIFNTSLSSIQVLNLYFDAAGGAPHVGPTTASPSNNVFSGTTVTISAAVSGLAPFQYQWQSNGVNLASATNATLVISNTVVADSANYDVVVSNSSGTNQSSTLVLTVKPPGAPVFTQQPTPAAATNYVGGLVTFTAVVDGSPPIQMQWARNGTNIPNATASSLTLASLQTGEGGNYTLSASNSFGATNSFPAVLTVLPPPNPSALNVLTYHNDNTRQGANTNEVLLTRANVNVSTFGRLITYPVDGYIYTQPLYVAGLVIPGQGTHNAVFVATEHNSVYAFDADNNGGPNGGVLWSTNLGASALSNNHEFGDRYNGNNYTDIVPEVGITGTPVIDPVSGTLYVDVRTRVVGVTTNYYHSIHALNITNGTEQSYSPVIVTNSVPGTGVDSSNGVVTFNPLQENERPALTLAGGMLYVAYGSFADTDPYHGWVLGFNAANLQQSSKYAFNTTPNATIAAFGANAAEGALWMGGNGLSVDASNNLYFETANGSFSANTNGGDYSDSFVKLSTTNGLAVADYFTPANQLSLANADADLGSGGPLLLPDSVGSAAHPHLIVGAGKEGKICLVDRDNMGQYSASTDNDVQEIPGAIGAAFSSPAYFNNQIYYQGAGDVTKGFLITNGVIVATPVSRATTSFSALGGTPSVSANGTNEGIVWTIQSDAFGSSGPAVLHAYNATNLALELYNSSQNVARDNPGGAIQMTTPTVVNGKVFVGAQYALSIFGNSLFLATPLIAPAGGSFTNSITVSLSDATPNSTIYYTLDGTMPTTNSLLYTGPFVLTNSATVQAIAAQPGAANSAAANAGFVDTSAVGHGAGLQGNYWTNASGTAFTNVNFTRQPTLTRTDAVVNFNWSSTGPSPSIGQTNFAVRWLGSIQPQYGETYTLTTIADDGVRLWVNGQLLISAWRTNSTTQTNSASIALKAQEIYSIQLDYFQNTGNAIAQLLWSSPSTPQALIPQLQLYPYTNPPPSVVLSTPTNGSPYTAAASISLTAEADALYNPLSYVSFYTNGVFIESVSNAPYAITATGIPAGTYILTASGTDGSGLSSTSAPVTITVAAGSGLAYGLTTNGQLAPFLNQHMPGAYTGPLPLLLSQTGAYSDTPNRVPSTGLISYVPNTPLWSDGAVKSRYLGLPNSGGLESPARQIGFAPTGQWTFPAGTVFVKNFDLVVDQTNPNTPLRRLETRLLVRDTNGAVYGVTYKWRPDNSEADLLTGSLTEAVLVTNATGVVTQNWYYPSPADCLTCHTPQPNYVLGVNSRQLNGTNTYLSTGVTDNQLRTLNRLGLLYPAFNEANITNFEQLSSVTNVNVPLVQRARSYLDANCAQCHQPGGTGITFDARYDTPLTNQNIINATAAFPLGYDNAKIVTPSDVWRSVLYDRMNSLDNAIKMPPLARNLIDSNAVATFAAWINSLGGTPALAPPVLTPAAGIFTNHVTVTLQPPDTNAVLYYTLDGSLPTTNSARYTGPFILSSSAMVTANAFEANYINSVAVSGTFTIVPPLYTIFAPTFLPNGSFEMQYWAPTNQTYILQSSTDLVHWTPVATNVPASAPFTLIDPGAAASPYRFYRVVAP
jgi:PA14 domain/Concanavalin A-like lectin/glucanases superfamily/Chitobiase/beta-hexosaminidase C-terminal domain/Immunoglobulin I-set domain